MRHPTACIAAAALIATTLAAPTRAQLLDTLKNATGGASGLAMPSLGGASSGNIAGLLQYCVQNRLAGGSGGNVENSLLGKLGGATAVQSQPAYTAGSKGQVQSGGQGFDLSNLGGTLKQQACDQVVQHARSLL